MAGLVLNWYWYWYWYWHYHVPITLTFPTELEERKLLRPVSGPENLERRQSSDVLYTLAHNPCHLLFICHC